MDTSYIEAMEAAGEPHRVLMGPVPCQRCSAWVEWAGVRWLNAGTRGVHECEPFLPATAEPEPEIIASWSRPAPTGYAYMQAFPTSHTEPPWARALGTVVILATAIVAAAFLGALAARLVAGGG